MTRRSDSNGTDRRRYYNGDGVHRSSAYGSPGVHRPLTAPPGWNAHRSVVPAAPPKTRKRSVPDSVYTLRGYKAWAAKVRADWDPES